MKANQYSCKVQCNNRCQRPSLSNTYMASEAAPLISAIPFQEMEARLQLHPNFGCCIRHHLKELVVVAGWSGSADECYNMLQVLRHQLFQKARHLKVNEPQ